MTLDRDDQPIYYLAIGALILAIIGLIEMVKWLF